MKQIDEGYRRGLLDERQKLLDKKFSGKFTRVEHIRLEWIRWQLDRLDAERYHSTFITTTTPKDE